MATERTWLERADFMEVGGVGGDVAVRLGLDAGVVGAGVLAGTVLGGVAVGRLVHGVVSLEVSEALVSPAAIAAVAGGVAINELLLGEGVEVAVGNALSTFGGGDGGEGPAGAALALVLDGVDTTVVNPVGAGAVELGDLGLVSDVLALGLVGKDGLVLGISPVGELVVAELEGLLGGVVLGDDGVLDGELAEAHLVLSHVGV